MNKGHINSFFKFIQEGLVLRVFCLNVNLGINYSCSKSCMLCTVCFYPIIMCEKCLDPYINSKYINVYCILQICEFLYLQSCAAREN